MRIVDLTHAFDEGMPVFPGLPDPSFRLIANVADDGYAMTELHLLNHIGTHVDAPAHEVVAERSTLAMRMRLRFERVYVRVVVAFAGV